eukprot:Opistho-2@94287
MTDMLEAGLVDIDIARLIGKRTTRHEGRGLLRRRDMDHVEGLCDLARLLSEGGRAVGAVDGDQGGLKLKVDPVAGDVFHQRRHELLHAEQDGARVVELDIDLLEHAGPLPVVAGQIHRLLRRAGAFDRHGRLGEQGGAVLQVLHQVPGVGGGLVAVVGGDAVLAERPGQAVDCGPVQGVAGRYDQGAVADRAAVLQRDLIALRLEAGDRALDPANTRRDHRRLCPAGVLHVEHPAAHHGPAWLIVVGLARLDHHDVEVAIAFQKRGGRGQTGRTSADNDHIGLLGLRADRGGHPGFQPGTQR